MRDRLLTRSAESLTDHELLEMLLFLGIERGDTRSIAKDLINTFGTLGRVLAASPQGLINRGALPLRAVRPLRVVQAASDRLARAEADERPVLNSLILVEAHLRRSAAPADHTRILFLDNRNRLLSDEPVEDGPILPTRLILRRALSLHATALLVVDIAEEAAAKPAAAATTRLAQAASLVSVTLYDRLVLSQSSLRSYRAAGLFKPVRSRR